MATNIRVESLPNLPDAPHHPKDFIFPKRSFGVSKQVLCSVQSSWFVSWPFLHYNEGLDVVYCHICITALKLNLIKSSKNFSDAFVSILFGGLFNFRWQRYGKRDTSTLIPLNLVIQRYQGCPTYFIHGPN